MCKCRTVHLIPVPFLKESVVGGLTFLCGCRLNWYYHCRQNWYFHCAIRHFSISFLVYHNQFKPHPYYWWSCGFFCHHTYRITLTSIESHELICYLERSFFASIPSRNPLQTYFRILPAWVIWCTLPLGVSS